MIVNNYLRYWMDMNRGEHNFFALKELIYWLIAGFQPDFGTTGISNFNYRDLKEFR
jgi:hypothetical protein